MENLDRIYDGAMAVLGKGFGVESRLWPLYLLLMVVIAAVLFLRRRPGGSFWAWLFPKSVYLHASHIVDIKVFLVSRLLSAAGFFQVVFLGSWVATKIAAVLGGPTGTPSSLNPLIAGLLLLVVNDFGVYWVHRVHHETRTLWPFHSLHHSAEVMTPITVFRKHPVYDLISSFVRGLFIGTLQGVLLGLVVGEVAFVTVAGLNAGYFLFNMLGANLRHTHIWLSYGPVWERILISPAQHQIHHSLEPRHFNKNYGEVLAIWDWMFGTLYVPKGEEKLEFGLADAEGRRLAQRHDSLTNAMVVPILDSWKQLRRMLPSPARRDRTPGE